MTEHPELLLIELHDAERRAGASDERLALIRARLARHLDIAKEAE